MTLILDTSPICFLVLIGEIEILPRLSAGLVSTPAVLQELSHPKAPLPVREWAQNPPPWLAIRSADSTVASSLEFLDPGERKVIALGLQLSDSVVVLDDHVAREEALKRGLAVTGLLGILDQAAKLELLDFRTALAGLQKTHFRLSPGLLKAILSRHEAPSGS